MALTAAAAVSGFVVVLLCVPVIQGQNGWTVTYTPTSVCAVKGSTVELSCSYTYPSREDGRTTEVQSKMWFKMQDNNPLDLKTDSRYTNRVTYNEGKNSLSHKVTIRDLKESDTAEYKFRFITDQPGGSYTGDPGVTLSVTDLKVEDKSYYERKCTSSCHLPAQSSFVWYKNGREITTTSSTHSLTYSDSNYHKDSYACALRGLEDFPSPPVCVSGDKCNRVTYTARSICASKGSSVDISCDFNSYETNVQSKLWFTTGPSPQQFSSPSGNSNQGGNSQSAARFQVLQPRPGHSTLRISDLRESDSAVYRFKFTAGRSEWGSSLHGTSLTVTALQVQVTRINLEELNVRVELRCHSSCSPDFYVWFKNKKQITRTKTSSYVGWFNLEDEISCAFEGQEHSSSPSVYAPKRPSVLLNPSAEILENNSVNLTCSSDANPAAKHTWYKKTENTDFQPVSEEQQLLFPSVQSSDSGEYYCTAENQLGKRPSEHVHIDVQYAPKVPSVKVSPSAEIEEGMSLTLSCSSDANPQATITWYKDNQTLLQTPDSIVSFTSIKSRDSGMYHCESTNYYGRKNSTSVHIDVTYAPKLPSVSVSPSAEIDEGSSVTLTCSSDANPAANYTWYKQHEDKPTASGQIFTITNFTAEHSGNYYCEAQNTRGRQNSSLRWIALAGSMKAVAAGSITVIILVVIFLCVFVLIRKKRSPKENNEPGERREDKGQMYMSSVINNPSAAAQRPSAEEEDDLCYATVSFSKSEDDPLSCNIVGVQRPRDEEDEDEDVEYTLVNVNSSCASPELKGVEED